MGVRSEWGRHVFSTVGEFQAHKAYRFEVITHFLIQYQMLWLSYLKPMRLYEILQLIHCSSSRSSWNLAEETGMISKRLCLWQHVCSFGCCQVSMTIFWKVCVTFDSKFNQIYGSSCFLFVEGSKNCLVSMSASDSTCNVIKPVCLLGCFRKLSWEIVCS